MFDTLEFLMISALFADLAIRNFAKGVVVVKGWLDKAKDVV